MATNELLLVKDMKRFKVGDRVKSNIQTKDTYVRSALSVLDGVEGTIIEISHNLFRDGLKYLVEFDSPVKGWHAHQLKVKSFFFLEGDLIPIVKGQFPYSEDTEITLVGEIVYSSDEKTVLYDWMTKLYTLDGAMIAYIEEDGELRRTNNEIDPLILEKCFDHFEEVSK